MTSRKLRKGTDIRTEGGYLIFFQYLFSHKVVSEIDNSCEQSYPSALMDQIVIISNFAFRYWHLIWFSKLGWIRMLVWSKFWWPWTWHLSAHVQRWTIRNLWRWKRQQCLCDEGKYSILNIFLQTVLISHVRIIFTTFYFYF